MTPRRILALVLRLTLGCVWLYAAYTKLRESWLVFAMSIDGYHMLPEWAVMALARSLPWVELAIGVLLIAGLGLRYVSIASAAILAGFFSVMALANSRGLAIDCGCFGPGDPLSKWTLLRDGTLLAAAIVLAVLSWRTVGHTAATPVPSESVAAHERA
jgi:uncharacterized membrane protein YphA (DoxX/SURF4 family)